MSVTGVIEIARENPVFRLSKVNDIPVAGDVYYDRLSTAILVGFFHVLKDFKVGQELQLDVVLVGDGVMTYSAMVLYVDEHSEVKR
jgi:predicted nicotinamide N-methyase